MKEIPRLTLGTVQLGIPYGVANRSGKPDTATAFAILDAAWTNGITMFDTAADYGTSESVIGEWMVSRSVEAKVITKISLSVGVLTSGNDGIVNHIRQGVEASLQRLRGRQLWGCMIHSFDDFGRYSEALCGVFDRMKNDGLVKHCGISVYAPEGILSAEPYPSFEIFQAPVNIFDRRFIDHPRLEQMFSDGQRQLFARSIYLQGLLLLSPAEAERRVPGSGRLIEHFETAAATAEMTIAQYSFSFVRSQPIVTSLVVGAETVEQITTNAGLMNANTPQKELFNQVYTTEVPASVYDPRLWPKE